MDAPKGFMPGAVLAISIRELQYIHPVSGVGSIHFPHYLEGTCIFSNLQRSEKRHVPRETSRACLQFEGRGVTSLPRFVRATSFRVSKKALPRNETDSLAPQPGATPRKVKAKKAFHLCANSKESVRFRRRSRSGWRRQTTTRTAESASRSSRWASRETRSSARSSTPTSPNMGVSL